MADLWVNADFLVEKVQYFYEHNDNIEATTFTYSAYESVNGVMMATKWRKLSNGRKSFSLKTLKVNPKLEPAYFNGPE